MFEIVLSRTTGFSTVCRLYLESRSTGTGTIASASSPETERAGRYFLTLSGSTNTYMAFPFRG